MKLKTFSTDRGKKGQAPHQSIFQQENWFRMRAPLKRLLMWTMGRGQGFQAVNIRELKKTLHNCQSFQIHILIGLAAIFIDAFLPDLSYHLTLMMKNRRPTQNMERLTDLQVRSPSYWETRPTRCVLFISVADHVAIAVNQSTLKSPCIIVGNNRAEIYPWVSTCNAC